MKRKQSLQSLRRHKLSRKKTRSHTKKSLQFQVTPKTRMNKSWTLIYNGSCLQHTKRKICEVATKTTTFEQARFAPKKNVKKFFFKV